MKSVGLSAELLGDPAGPGVDLPYSPFCSPRPGQHRNDIVSAAVRLMQEREDFDLRVFVIVSST